MLLLSTLVWFSGSLFRPVLSNSITKPVSVISYHFNSDIDECQPSKNNCHFDAECVNTEGSYECRCRPGYQGNGFTCVCKLCFFSLKGIIEQ